MATVTKIAVSGVAEGPRPFSEDTLMGAVSLSLTKNTTSRPNPPKHRGTWGNRRTIEHVSEQSQDISRPKSARFSGLPFPFLFLACFRTSGNVTISIPPNSGYCGILAPLKGTALQVSLLEEAGFGIYNPVSINGLYPVLVVTLPSGVQYMPTTEVKDRAQALIAGALPFTPIYIAVPPGVDPQKQVDYWKAHYFYFDNESLFRAYFAARGAHDYKLDDPIWDAYGNFNYGACCYAAGVSHWLMQKIANHKPGGNNPINTRDIDSGYNAIKRGGKLSVQKHNLVAPPLP
ncbi:MAG: hypothetical protein ACREE6_14240 [Limisphaerales bacterium]